MPAVADCVTALSAVGDEYEHAVAAAAAAAAEAAGVKAPAGGGQQKDAARKKRAREKKKLIEEFNKDEDDMRCYKIYFIAMCRFNAYFCPDTLLCTAL